MAVYLESTVEAVNMYKRLGFKVVGGFDMVIPNRDEEGGSRRYQESCMLWQPA